MAAITTTATWITFQSHAGSIEAQVPSTGYGPWVEFQSHAGSIEAENIEDLQRTDHWFQSHAGSIEATLDRNEHNKGQSVSIPRWFD